MDNTQVDKTDPNETVVTSRPIYDAYSKVQTRNQDQKEILIVIDGSSVSWQASKNITMAELVGALDITKSQILKDMFPDTLQKLIQKH